jgi:hypothetical protein
MMSLSFGTSWSKAAAQKVNRRSRDVPDGDAVLLHTGRRQAHRYVRTARWCVNSANIFPRRFHRSDAELVLGNEFRKNAYCIAMATFAIATKSWNSASLTSTSIRLILPVKANGLIKI